MAQARENDIAMIHQRQASAAGQAMAIEYGKGQAGLFDGVCDASRIQNVAPRQTIEQSIEEFEEMKAKFDESVEAGK